jgi:hypothetical protein
MSQEPGNLEEKRQKALQKLRSNRGKDRPPGESRQKAKADGVKVLLKDFRDTYRAKRDLLQDPELVEKTKVEVEDPQQLPRISKALKRLQEKDEKTTEAAQRLKEARQRFKATKEQYKQEEQKSPTEIREESEVTDEAPAKRQKLRQDLLSADFFKTASKWLGSVRTDPELTSTPVEEVEFLHKQAVYRHKVLKIMLDDTQREIDALESYLKIANSVSN